jgi:hypothetical protein
MGTLLDEAEARKVSFSLSIHKKVNFGWIATRRRPAPPCLLAKFSSRLEHTPYNQYV